MFSNSASAPALPCFAELLARPALPARAIAHHAPLAIVPAVPGIVVFHALWQATASA